MTLSNGRFGRFLVADQEKSDTHFSTGKDYHLLARSEKFRFSHSFFCTITLFILILLPDTYIFIEVEMGGFRNINFIIQLKNLI